MGKTYIISYPRSGNTAFRYVLEMLTGQPTNGLIYPDKPNINDSLQLPLLHQGVDFVAHKRHDFRFVQEGDYVFFVIRDYKEAIIRHNEKPRGLGNENLSAYIDGYCQLLSDYDLFPGGKMAIYYENLTEIAHKASRDIYPDAQSTSADHHKSKLNGRQIKMMDEYTKNKYPELWEKYLSRYETK